MTIEEVLEGLKDAEIFAAVKEKLDLKTADEVNGLVENQQKLKKEKLKLKEKLNAYGDNDPEDVERLHERIEEFEKSGKKINPDLSFKEKMELDKLKKQVEETNKQGDFWKGKYISTLQENLIDKILDENKVNPAFKRVLKSDLSTATKVIEEDGEVSLIVNTDKGDLQLGDYAKEYFATDEGKVFLTKPQNTGGGAATYKDGARSSESVGDILVKVQSGDKNATVEAMKRIEQKQSN